MVTLFILGRSPKPNRPHTQAGVAAQTAVLEACYPNSLCVQSIALGHGSTQLSIEDWDGKL